jgi:glucoamylase
MAGIPPRWTSARSGVGRTLSAASRVWFTTSHGILDEIYRPSIVPAHDLGLIVTDGDVLLRGETRR